MKTTKERSVIIIIFAGCISIAVLCAPQIASMLSALVDYKRETISIQVPEREGLREILAVCVGSRLAAFANEQRIYDPTRRKLSILYNTGQTSLASISFAPNGTIFSLKTNVSDADCVSALLGHAFPIIPVVDERSLKRFTTIMSLMGVDGAEFHFEQVTYFKNHVYCESRTSPHVYIVGTYAGEPIRVQKRIPFHIWDANIHCVLSRKGKTIADAYIVACKWTGRIKSIDIICQE